MNPKAHLEATKRFLLAAKRLQAAGVENADEIVEWFEKEVARLEKQAASKADCCLIQK